VPRPQTHLTFEQHEVDAAVSPWLKYLVWHTFWSLLLLLAVSTATALFAPLAVQITLDALALLASGVTIIKAVATLWTPRKNQPSPTTKTASANTSPKA
jgi:uncharacterized membrane-anchored protein